MQFKNMEQNNTLFTSFDEDLSEMINTIYIGPQGTLLESLDAFNRKYNVNVGITKHFTFKPGSYDIIKNTYCKHVLRWDMKPSGMNSIFRRIRDYGWRLPSFKTDIVNLEMSMKVLRTNGMVWQDNTEDLHNEVAKLKRHAAEGIDRAKKMFTDIEVEMKMLPVYGTFRANHSRDMGNFPAEMTEFSGTLRDYIIFLYIKLKKPMLTVHTVTSDGVERRHMPLEDIIVCSGAYMSTLLNRNWGRDNLREDNVPTTVKYFLNCMYLSSMGLNKHPYIGTSTDKYRWDIPEGLSQDRNALANICVGNMGREIKSSFINFQIDAHISYIVMWLTNYYVPQTHPLHRLTNLYARRKDITIQRFHSDFENNSVFTQRLTHWNECLLGSDISKAIMQHGRCYYDGASSYSNNFIYGECAEVTNARKLEYIQKMDLKDFGCEQCTFNTVCQYYAKFKILFSKEALSPENEGYMGMVYENYQYLNSRSIQVPLSYIEELVKYFRREYDEQRTNQQLLMANAIYIRWTGIEHSREWNSPSYVRRLGAIMRINQNELEVLYTFAIDPNNHYEWHIDNITHFIASQAQINAAALVLKQEQGVIAEDITRPVVSWEDPFQDLPFVEEPTITIDLTPEQATLQWASVMGGAENL